MRITDRKCIYIPPDLARYLLSELGMIEYADKTDLCLDVGGKVRINCEGGEISFTINGGVIGMISRIDALQDFPRVAQILMTNLDLPQGEPDTNSPSRREDGRMGFFNKIGCMMKRNVITEIEIGDITVRHRTTDPSEIDIVDSYDEPVVINQSDAAELARILAHFAEHGTLPEATDGK